MAQDLSLKVGGLHTDPNPLQEIPNGALKRALNVVIRRRGVAEPRPGFVQAATDTGLVMAQHVMPFDGGFTVLGHTSAPAQRWRKTNGTNIQIGGIDAQYVVGETHHAEMQRRLYVPLQWYVARYNDGADSVAWRAGVPQPAQPLITGMTQDSVAGWLQAEHMVGYRVVFTKKIGGQLLLSAPSAPSYAMPTRDWALSVDSGDDFYVTMRVYLPPSTITSDGDVVQVYRTVSASSETGSTTPGDEMRLMTSYVLTSTDRINGYIDLTDKLPDAQLTGAALYTNATQQGILLSNYTPPRVGCLATYADMLFGGNVTGVHELTLEMTGAPARGEFDFGDKTRIWPARRINSDPTATFGAGVNTITVANWFGDTFLTGRYVADVGGDFTVAGTYFQAGTKISVVTPTGGGGYTLTLDKNTLAAGTSFDYWPKVTNYNSNAGGTWQWNASSTWIQRLTPVAAARPGCPDGSYVCVGTQQPHQSSSAGIYAGTRVTGKFTPSGTEGLSLWWRLSLSRPTSANSGSDRTDVVFRYYHSPVSVGAGTPTTVAVPALSATFTIQGPWADDAFALGMEVTDIDRYPGEGGGAVFAAGTRITGLSYNSGTSTLTITLSQATVNAAPANCCAVWDWIEVDGTKYYGAEKSLYDEHAGVSSIFLYDRSTLWSFQQLAARAYFDNGGYYAVQAYGGGEDPRSFVIQAIDGSYGAMVVKSTKPDAFNEYVDRTTGVSTAQETRYNRLVWSKPQEPDAFPLGYYVDVGSASARILRVLPTRESLFVFKEDGVWRVSGTGPDTLRVDEYDRTLRLIHPSAVSQVGNALVGWFVSGVELITDAERASLSADAIDEELSAVRAAPVAAPWTGDICAWSDNRNGEWCLAVGDGAGTPSNTVYVYNSSTQSWVKWQLTGSGQVVAGGAEDSSGGRSLLCGAAGGQWYVFTETAAGAARVDIGGVDYVNVSGALVGALKEGYEFTLTVPVGVLAKGSMYTAGGHDYYVLSTLTATTARVWSRTASASFGPGNATGYQPRMASVEWVARVQQNPGVRKHFREASFIFESLGSPLSELYFSSDVDASEQVSAVNLSDGVRPQAVRALVPRNTARGFWINPRIDIYDVKAQFELLGSTLVYEWMNERVSR